MNPDFLDLLIALNAAEARFLVVGGYAVGVHGRPRATKDLDVWVEASVDNAGRVLQALRDFGARSSFGVRGVRLYIVYIRRKRVSISNLTDSGAFCHDTYCIVAPGSPSMTAPDSPFFAQPLIVPVQNIFGLA